MRVCDQDLIPAVWHITGICTRTHTDENPITPLMVQVGLVGQCESRCEENLGFYLKAVVTLKVSRRCSNAVLLVSQSPFGARQFARSQSR